VFLYAADTWTLLSADVRTLDAFHQKCLRQLLVNVIVVEQAPTGRIAAARRSQLLLYKSQSRMGLGPVRVCLLGSAFNHHHFI